ncbi:MAG: phenylalanine--tRNA ligase subunit beta [Gemmatimonadaceae bacterium]|nr:phenylalanine--tRNA ligase subunit beta [Gemmatimonadaceae bacterium]
MNASYEWLKAIVPFEYTPEQLRDLITARCCPVDELVHLRADLANVVVGQVVEAGAHPDSDHLWVTKVDAGKGDLLDVVCGAPNVKVGAKYPFAAAGTILPGGLKLEKRKIRGATSNGMLCSARELGLGQEHDGILELETSLPPGTPFLDAMPVGDTRIVVDVTPNRPDLLSHLGLAREIAAATGGAAALPALDGANATVPVAARADREGTAGKVRVTLEDPEGCPRIAGIFIGGVKVGPSPAWLVERLAAVGSRSINNVVDATNYMLHEVGQPMHAYDASLLAGAAIVARRARAGETLRTLDGVDRKLDPSMTVIADADRAQGVAGVMGGSTSEVSDATTEIFLEVAYFDPASIRRTRRTLNLSTDASYRFERGIDIDGVPRALERAAQLLIAVAGGSIEGAPVDLYPQPRHALTINIDSARVAKLLGEPVAEPEIAKLLAPVGFTVGAFANARASVAVPAWRPDVTQSVDLVEEIARLRGYDSFSNELRPFRRGTVPDSPLAVLTRRVRETCVAAGLLEALSMPFVRGGDDSHVKLANPMAEDEGYLRRDLLETLGKRAEHNLAQRHRDVRLFEIGSVFAPSVQGLPREEMRVAAIVMGHRHPPHWTDADAPDFDEWDAKGLAELIATSVGGASQVELRDAPDGALWEIAIFGEARGVVRGLALDAPVWAPAAFGVELTLVHVSSTPVAPPGQSKFEHAELGAANSPLKFRPFPSTPSTFVDVALLVPNDLAASRVESVIRDASGELLESLTLLSEYRGAGIGDGYRSAAWRLTFRHPERTLRDKEVAGRRDKVLKTLEGELGVRQRTT